MFRRIVVYTTYPQRSCSEPVRYKQLLPLRRTRRDEKSRLRESVPPINETLLHAILILIDFPEGGGPKVNTFGVLWTAEILPFIAVLLSGRRIF